MHDRLARARDAVDEAREITDDATAMEQLASVRQGIERVDDALADDAADEGEVADPEAGDRLESIERQLGTLADDVDDLTVSHLSTARDQLDAFRRESAADWTAPTGDDRVDSTDERADST
ncbi:DUF7553 family protein [Halosimplex halophilum]|uniref:DUF7553 family protein n=1 Tax=Halosimplex halophilum TaxID=2559572 RepID=UPI00107F0AFB|nr:hypothetical protein [Halosimplex halophilum]